MKGDFRKFGKAFNSAASGKIKRPIKKVARAKYFQPNDDGDLLLARLSLRCPNCHSLIQLKDSKDRLPDCIHILSADIETISALYDCPRCQAEISVDIDLVYKVSVASSKGGEPK